MQCCSCYYFSEDRNWSKTLRNFPKISILTCSDGLAQGGKKRATSSFEKGMFTISTRPRNPAIFM